MRSARSHYKYLTISLRKREKSLVPSIVQVEVCDLSPPDDCLFTNPDHFAM